MKTALIDLREHSAIWSSTEIDSLIREYDALALVLLGHGSPTSVAGLTATTFPKFPSAQVIWIYACNCGKSLIGQISKASLLVFGYVTTVLAPDPIESTIASQIQTLMTDYNGGVTGKNILYYVQAKLFEEAVRLVSKSSEEMNGRFLLEAALINHSRLSIRFAGGP